VIALLVALASPWAQLAAQAEAAGDPALAAAYLAHAPGAEPQRARLLAAAGDCPAAQALAAADPTVRAACQGQVRVDAPGATVTIDKTPLNSKPLWAGPHALTLVWPGQPPRHAMVCARPGETVEVALTPDAPTLVGPGTPRARAFAHQEAAFAHLRAEHHCAAAAELEAAFALDGTPGHLYNRALVLALWPDHCGAALAAFDRFLTALPTGADADDARSRRAALATTCTGTLAVTTPRAELRVDGQPVMGVATLPPGPHRLEARAPGHQPLVMEVPVTAGHARRIALLPLGPPPEADVALAPWIASGVAVVGVAAGGTFLGLAAGDRDEVERWQTRGLREATERYRGRENDARSAFDRDQTLAWVGFGLAGAALSTAVTLWVWP